MPSSPDEKASALCKALAIIEARIRYNKSLIAEWRTCDKDKVKDLVLTDPFHRYFVENIDNSETVYDELQRAMIIGCLNDIELLTKLKLVIQAYSEKYVTTSLSLACFIETMLHHEEKMLHISRKNEHQELAFNLVHASEDRMSEYYTYKDIKKIFEDAEIFGPKEQEFLTTYTEFIEAEGEGYMILNGQAERLLIKHNKYFVQIEQALNKLSFDQDLNKLPVFLFEFVEDTRAMLKASSKAIKSCNDFMEEQIKYPTGRKISTLVDTYNNIYELKSLLKELLAQISKATDEINIWKAAELKLQKEEQERLFKLERQNQQIQKQDQIKKQRKEPAKLSKEQLAKAKEPVKLSQEQLAKAKEPAKLSQEQLAKAKEPVKLSQEQLAKAKEPVKLSQEQLAKAKEPAKLSQEQLAKAKEPAKLSQEQLAKTKELEIQQHHVAEMERKNENERKQELEKSRENIIKWKTKVAIEKTLRKQEEIDAHNQLVYKMTMHKVIDSDSSGQLKSTFRLPDEIIVKYKNRIKEILSEECTKFSYKKALSFIKALGGKVNISTGSSHQKIIFGDSVYQYLKKQTTNQEQEEEARQDQFVAGFYRPHNGETELKRYELGLFKDMLRSILPEKFLLQLEEGSLIKEHCCKMSMPLCKT